MMYKAQININWPDDVWEKDVEHIYLAGCLRELADNVMKHRPHPDIPRQLCNYYGRVFAELEIKLCKA